VSNSSKHLILVVDDDAMIRETMSMLLTSEGYDVALAQHGLDALLQMRTILPSVIISDLNMPQMSGFEFLSVVRRRFPEIPVVAISGAYDHDSEVPGGVIADAFYPKGAHSNPQTMLDIVADLISTSAVRTIAHQRQSAPVWVPRNGKDSHGVPYIVLTCTDCLRSFPMNVASEDLHRVQETPCLFCPNSVRYIVDFSLSIASPRIDAARSPHRQGEDRGDGLSRKAESTRIRRECPAQKRRGDGI
jgi:CheY-like chemotaxis protein